MDRLRPDCPYPDFLCAGIYRRCFVVLRPALARTGQTQAQPVGDLPMRLITATALAVLLACPAVAAPNCAHKDDVTALLTEKYGEEIISLGIDLRGSIVAWWGNTETGTWTATVTHGSETCIVAQGDNFQNVSLQPNV